MEDFKRGDIVRLKSGGGPLMVVVDTPRHMAGVAVDCRWHSPDGNLHKDFIELWALARPAHMPDDILYVS